MKHGITKTAIIKAEIPLGTASAFIEGSKYNNIPNPADNIRYGYLDRAVAPKKSMNRSVIPSVVSMPYQLLLW